MIRTEDFQTMILDYFQIAARRDLEIMAQGSDILAKIAALNSSFDALKGTIDKAITDMSETVPAGHAAVLDTFIAPLDEMVTKVGALSTEVEAKIKGMPVPGGPAITGNSMGMPHA